MAIVIQCDACGVVLGRDVVGARFYPGAMQNGIGGEPRFIGSGRLSEFLLCEDCAVYLERCFDALSAGGVPEVLSAGEMREEASA